MEDIRIQEQIMRKIESWRQLLAYLQVENTAMKTRIAEIVSWEIDRDLLAELENFQTLFLRNDELIALTRTELAMMKRLVLNEFSENGILERSMRAEQKLDKEIGILEQKFNTLKKEFSYWLTEKCSQP
jgi:hypothetical protein